LGVAARNATLELFHGLLNEQVIDDDVFSAALVRAAHERIESRLLADPGLDPQTIADALHISLRTLHRAFATSGSSVMEHVRKRRLEQAAAELLSTSWTVAEIAARWHFSDSSHFIRAHKKRYGETPAARRRVSTA
jgi:AraC-like DNA-binding protein